MKKYLLLWPVNMFSRLFDELKVQMKSIYYEYMFCNIQAFTVTFIYRDKEIIYI